MRVRSVNYVWFIVPLVVSGLTGCLDRELKPLNPCLVSGVSRKVQVKNVDKVDLLFMVDNSNSMAGEQQSLRAQFPNVIKVLTTGERMPGDPNPFPPAKDLHVGIVDSDMGIAGVEFGNCHADGGDDGRLQHTPRGANCDATYPLFLSYIGDPKIGQVTDPTKFANDVGCIANLGTGGCGFEQQLESPLKALWPSIYTDANGNVQPNPITFLSTTKAGMLGHGDVPESQGGNLGFLRNDPAQGLSLIAIVVVTDEEDCSVRTTEHLWPTQLLPADSPYKSEVDINLRCFYHPELSFDVMNRYYKGFRGLRQGNEQLVVFAAITGVPPDLVDQKTLDGVDFTNDDQRNAFYNNILNDSRMQNEIDPATMPGSGNGNLKVSCSRPVPGEKDPSTAYPPRRIVQLAQAFGTNGIVQSICQDDFGPAMDAIINVIAHQLGEVCLPRPLVRQNDGLVACNVVWELPKTSPSGSGTPTDCSQESFLGPVDSGGATTNAAGGNNCKVKQLPVTDTSTKAEPAGDGWYYDDFTDDLARTCSKTQPQRVAFTSNAKPPTGVTVKLECLNETQTYVDATKDLSPAQAQPNIGTACGADVVGATVSGDKACVQTLSSGDEDDSMFCHPELNVCVRKCTGDPDCPPAWVCDTRADTVSRTDGKGAYCVNPTCGADTTTSM